jgi:hypothetical protein
MIARLVCLAYAGPVPVAVSAMVAIVARGSATE